MHGIRPAGEHSYPCEVRLKGGPSDWRARARGAEGGDGDRRVVGGVGEELPARQVVPGQRRPRGAGRRTGSVGCHRRIVVLSVVEDSNCELDLPSRPDYLLENVLVQAWKAVGRILTKLNSVAVQKTVAMCKPANPSLFPTHAVEPYGRGLANQLRI